MTVIKADKSGERNPKCKGDIPDELRDAIKSASGFGPNSKAGEMIITEATDKPNVKRARLVKRAEARWNEYRQTR